MCNCEDLRPANGIFTVDQCVREAIEVVDAQPVLAMRAALLVLDDEIAHAFVLSEKGLCDARLA